MPTHETSIELGHTYRDSATGFEGTAVSIHFYCGDVQRVTIATLDKNGAVAEQTFEAGRLKPCSLTATNGNLGFTSVHNADT